MEMGDNGCGSCCNEMKMLKSAFKSKAESRDERREDRSESGRAGAVQISRELRVECE